jgi:hypothetical protein
MSDQMTVDPLSELRKQVRQAADILINGSGSVPAADVGWQLRRILEDPNCGVPDAEVVANARVIPRDLRPDAVKTARAVLGYQHAIKLTGIKKGTRPITGATEAAHRVIAAFGDRT